MKTAAPDTHPSLADARPSRPRLSGADRCKRKFLRLFPRGFRDAGYLASERDYKWEAHRRWQSTLHQAEYLRLLNLGDYAAISARAVAVEQSSPYSFIFSFEKMALRDALKSPSGARAFALGLYDFLHGTGSPQSRFEDWVEVVAALPRRQTRVLTWPVVTVFGFLAQPTTHFFMKPKATRAAALAYGHPIPYQSRPSWETYVALLALARQIKRDLRDLGPRDMIDIQSFLWVQGSDEYSG
jgi:hypothetical protein